MYSEEQWDRRWRIRTCGRDTQAEDEHHSPYEPTPYAVLDRLADSGLIGRETPSSITDAARGGLPSCSATAPDAAVSESTSTPP